MNYLTNISRNLTYSRCMHQLLILSNSIKVVQRIEYPCKSFHTSKRFSIKMYMEHENNYAYSIMESKGYSISLNSEKVCESITTNQFNSLIQEDWSKKSPQEIFEVFPKMGAYCAENSLCISNKMFDNFIDNLTDNIKHASNEELQSIFYGLTKWPETDSVRTRNYIEVWAALDHECLQRHRDWSIDDILSFISLFYLLNVTKGCDFPIKALNKISSKAKRLTPAQIVQTLFFIGILRKSPFDVHCLELHLNENFSNFTIDDLAIMSMGLFKSKTPIRSMELASKIIDKITENASEIHEISLASLLKVIRYSVKQDLSDKIYTMLEAFEPQVPRLSLMCCVHLALLGTSTLTLHERCLNKIAEKFSQNIQEARLKDLERLVLTYGILNHKPHQKDDIFEKVVQELRNPNREAEIAKYGRSFACCVAFLSVLGVYPEDLMSKVLDPIFLEKFYGKYPAVYSREVLTIHNTAEIFCKDSTMNRLSRKAAIILAKKFTDYIPDENFKNKFNITEQMIFDVIRILREARGGHEFVKGDHILTHHQRGDIILCNDKKGSPLPVEGVFPEQFGLIHRPPTDDNWIVLVVAGRNAILRNRSIATGPFHQKLVELRKIGYHANMIKWDVWSKLQSNQEKYRYLNELINEALNIK